MSERYFINKFSDYQGNQTVQVDKTFIQNLIGKYVESVLKNTDPRKYKNFRADLYVGLSGIAFMFLKLSQSPLKDLYPALELAKLYADAAEESLILSGSRKHISLLSGDAGVHVVSAAVNKAIGRSPDNDIQNLLKGISIFNNPEYLDDGQDEMLVGRCGYLMGINWLSQQINSEVISSNEMTKLAQIMLDSGRKYSQANNLDVPLMYQYHGREYLGAAHGISAILFSLLQTDLIENDMKDVRETIDKILTLQDSSGNFPSKYNKPDAHLVHWCHGSPGIVYLMAKAFKIFGEQKYLDSCLKSGDLVWEKGLLKKGPGICHGIGSSGYVHLLLYRLTNDQKHLYRAQKFAEFLVDEEFLSEAREPDRPFSLFEGISGTICYLLDLLEPEHSEYPFMNVF
ncbi:lanC-like protein 3 homolog [Chironomus tepperi]|uniref:lanC-like protein 3 homolog n=1 Tax=Chironomus tepperi TaxID=113505 RepID=UPI00391F491D